MVLGGVRLLWLEYLPSGRAGLPAGRQARRAMTMVFIDMDSRLHGNDKVRMGNNGGRVV